MSAAIAEVALGLPLRRTFHYRVPEPLIGRVVPGSRVRVPFGPRRLAGWCVGLPDRAEVEHLRDVETVLGDGPLADEELLQLTRWMAERYLASWGQALELAVPAAVKAGRPSRQVPVVEATEAGADPARAGSEKRRRVLEVLRDAGGPMRLADAARRAGCTPSVLRRMAEAQLVRMTMVEADIEWIEEPDPEESVRVPTADQERALAELRAMRGHGVLLIRGVTGSGKTEIYFRAAQETIRSGRQALFLVPEIALTAQMVSRVRARFERVAVVHSQMSPWERARAWREARAGAVDLVIGARSAVFTPFRDLGLIVIDEEHDASYKEQTAPRYHAREVAEWRARRRGIPLILGGATPSVESYWRARQGIYRLVEITRRVGQRSLPAVEIVAMDRERERQRRPVLLSRRLRQALAETLEAGRQAILFLNRRGFATFVTCRRCGWTLRCRRCDAGMTVHRQLGRALCHYCLQGADVPATCPQCHVGTARQWGAGTERVAEEVRRLHPQASVIRMDSDSITTRRRLQEALAAFREGRAQVLVGTRMVTKGLHFPRVTLVGVVDADTAFLIPDFRAAEVTFQEISQVAGRPGRGDQPGRVILQTMHAGHNAVAAAARHDYTAFFEREIEHRQELGYPPFGTVFRILFEARDATKVQQVAELVCGELAAAMAGLAEIVGPAPAPLSRLRGIARFHAILKARNDEPVRPALERILASPGSRRGVTVSIDVDPYGMM